MRILINTFILVLLSCNIALAVGAPDFYPDGAHPRIWLTSSELSRLASLRDASDTKWTSLVSWCDTHINDAGYNIDPGGTSDLTKWKGDNDYDGYRMSGWNDHLFSYALAYQILKQPGPAQNTTKANTYAARAKTLMIDGIAVAMRAGEENNGLRAIRVGEVHDKTINLSESTALGIGLGSYKDGFAARFMAAVPISYDWVYDTLSSEDRTILTNMMLRWYDWIRGVRSTYNNGVLKDGLRYHEDKTGDCTGNNICTSATGAATQGYKWTNIANNFSGGQFFYMSSVLMATFDGSTESISYFDSFNTHLSTNIIGPLESNLLHSGGDSPEGWNYGGGFIYTLPGLYGYYTATGNTAVTLMDWPKKLVKAALHRVSGDYKSVPMWGAWTGLPIKENRISHVSPIVNIEKKLRPTGEDAKLGQWLLDNSTFTTSLTAWQNLFYNSLSVGDESPIIIGEPLSYVARGNGLFASRSSWNADNGVVHVTARLEGKITTSHEGYDEGHISLLRGQDVLLAHDNADDPPHAVSFNSLVFNNADHHIDNPVQSSPSIDRYIDAAEYSYVSGDITNAWKRQSKPDLALFFRRSILHLRPGIIVVYDLTRSNSAIGNLKEWYTQYEADPSISSDTIAVTNGGSRAFIKSLYPAGSFTETNPSTGYYRVKYVPATTQEYDQFLHVIEAGSSTASQTSATLITGTGGRGALIGDTVAMFTDDQAGEVITDLSYNANATTHYIADLPLSSNVEVFRGGVSIGTYNTGVAGIIAFLATAGEATYTIGDPVVVEPSCDTDASLCSIESACTTAWPAYHFCSGVCQSAACPAIGVMLPTSYRIPGGVPYGIVQ